MTVRKRKKNSRQRGGWTHGGGAKKKRRGAGHRGGRGNAGSSKRGDAKKPSYWKDRNWQGKIGFVKHNAIKVRSINIGMVQSRLEKWVKDRKIEAGVIDLGKMGYDKLLGEGYLTDKLNIKVKMVSEIARKKVEEKGGKILTEASESKKVAVEEKPLKTKEPKEN